MAPKQKENLTVETVGRGENCKIFPLHFNHLKNKFNVTDTMESRYQWPSGLGRESAAAPLLGLRVRIPPRPWMSVSRECCVLSGRGL